MLQNIIWESIRTNSDILTVKYNGLQLHQWEYRATSEIKKSMVHKNVICRQFEKIGLEPPVKYII